MFRLQNLILLLFAFPFLSNAQNSTRSFEIFGGTSFTSFHRSDQLPINPLSEDFLLGFEGGIRVALAKSKTYQPTLALSFFQHGASEVFESIDGQLFDTEVKFSAVKADVRLLNFKIGKGKVKFLIGAGGIVVYNLSNTFSATPELTANFRDDLFESLNYGGQVHLGIQFGKIHLSYQAFNMMNPLSEGENGFNTIYSRGSGITLGLMIGKPSKTDPE